MQHRINSNHNLITLAEYWVRFIKLTWKIDGFNISRSSVACMVMSPKCLFPFIVNISGGKSGWLEDLFQLVKLIKHLNSGANMGFGRLGQTEGTRKQESRHWRWSCMKRKIVSICSCTKDDYHYHGCLAPRQAWGQQRGRSEEKRKSLICPDKICDI